MLYERPALVAAACDDEFAVFEQADLDERLAWPRSVRRQQGVAAVAPGNFGQSLAQLTGGERRGHGVGRGTEANRKLLTRFHPLTAHATALQTLRAHSRQLQEVILTILLARSGLPAAPIRVSPPPPASG